MKLYPALSVFIGAFWARLIAGSILAGTLDLPYEERAIGFGKAGGVNGLLAQ